MSDYIPQDSLDQIYPPKAYCDSDVCCKQWKEIIDSPSFVLDHLAIQKPLFIMRTLEDCFTVVDPNNIPSIRMIRRPLEGLPTMPLGSNHGIICLRDLGHGVWLWNPAIRKLLTLPSFSIDFESIFKIPCNYCSGFWIDPSNKEFKITILVFNIDEDNKAKHMDGVLYSSTRHDWSAISPAKLWRDWFPSSLDPPITIGCIAHWGGLSEYKKTIMSFDFKQESFDFIEIPDLNYYYSPRAEPKLCKWQNSLSLLCSHPTFPNGCDIYLRHHGSWVKMFNFNFAPPPCDYFWLLLLGEMEKRFWVLGQCRWENQDALNFDLLLYDTRVGTIYLKDDFRCWYAIYDFVEGLLFP